ncbi:hypothetical protein cypCar_00043618 [Cyprinus carpio]|nr:hypothetical protein cypCar_00043618 [Cyprinus carpio]
MPHEDKTGDQCEFKPHIDCPGITIMNAVNALQLFILVWTFTAVCQDYDDNIVSCDDVTGSVGKEVTLTCSAFLQITECCIIMYKFQYPEIFNDSAICRQYFPYDPCEQRNSFTCSYTPTTAMTEQFRFFVLTMCGVKVTEFTVDITEELLEQTTDTEAPDKKGIVIEAIVITAVSCFIIIIIIIIIIVTAINCVKKFKSTNPSGLQKKYERGVSKEQTVMTTNV